ncbi:MAG: DUF177 domain-containing protein [bacterium]|nr:DUF177 domain-containing protein [bacterium]
MIIKIRGLEEGEHTFNFEESSSEYDLDQNNFTEDLNSVVKIDLLGKNYYIKVVTETIYKAECDRCLKDILLDLSVITSMVYTEDNTLDPEHQADDLRILPANEDTADLTDVVRQQLSINIPMKNLCTDECKGLCSNCGADLNIKQCKCKKDNIDPRWEALKNIKLD